MKKIGNIICNGLSKGFGDMFNIVNDYSLIDDKLPTLIIGFDNATNLIKNFSILKKDYNNGMLRWTFKRSERRNEYNKDLSDFKEYCIMRNVKKVKYDYIDIMLYPYSKIKKVINYINSVDDKLCFVTKNSSFIFIYSNRYNMVWGLSLSLCEYFDIDKQKVLNKIKQNKHNRFIKDIGLINDDIRKKIGENTHYLLPTYLYFD